MFKTLFLILVFLLSIYGTLSLMICIGSIIWHRMKIENPDIRLVLVVKNQEEALEGIIRSIFKEDLLRKSMCSGILNVIDAGSKDQSREILQKLKDEYEYINIIRYEDREKIFEGFAEK